jgi:hypothetical protein
MLLKVFYSLRTIPVVLHVFSINGSLGVLSYKNFAAYAAVNDAVCQVIGLLPRTAA